MKIITHDENKEAKEAVAFYKNSFIRKNDLYANSPKCHEHETYKVVLDFDNNYNEQGLVVRKDEQ